MKAIVSKPSCINRWIAPGVCLWVISVPLFQGFCQDAEGQSFEIVSSVLLDNIAASSEKEAEGALLAWLEPGEKRFRNLLQSAIENHAPGARQFLFGKTLQIFSVQDVEKRLSERSLALAMQSHQVNVAQQEILASKAALKPTFNASVQYKRSKTHKRSAMIGRLRERAKTWEVVTTADIGMGYTVTNEDGTTVPQTVSRADVGKTWFELGMGSESCILVDGEAIGDTCGTDILYDIQEEFASMESEKWSQLWSGSLGVNTPLSWGGAVNANLKTTYLPYNAPVSLPLKAMGAPLETALNVGDREWVSNLSLTVNAPLPYTKNFGSDGFGTAVQVKKAVIDHEKSRSARAAQVNQIFRDGVSSYWSMVRNQLVVLSAVEHRTLLEQRVARVERLYQIERVTEYDRMQAKANLEDARNQEEMAWNNWIASSNILAELLDLPAEQVIVPQKYRDVLTVDVDLDDSSVLQTALASRAELRSAQLDVQKSEVEKQYRLHQLLPDVTLTASYNALGKGSGALFGYDSFGDSVNALGMPDERNYFVGLVYSHPWGQQAEKSRHANANARYTQAMDRARITEMQVAQDVSSASAALHGSQARVGMAQAELRLAGEVLRGADRMYDLERMTEFEFLRRQNSLFNARINLIHALIDRQQSQVDLAFAQGKWEGEETSTTMERAP